MKICTQILGDVARVQFVAEEPGFFLDLAEEFPPGPTADALRELGDGVHIVDDAFFDRLQGKKPTGRSKKKSPRALSESEQETQLLAEIMLHVFGDDAEQLMFTEAPVAAFDESKIKRGSDGRFAEKGSAKAFSAAKETIAKALKGKKTPKSAEALASKLSNLTVKQLTELKKEYGIKASGNKQVLIDKLADRLDRGRRAEQKSRLKKVKKVREPKQPEPEPEQPEPEAVEDTDDEPTAEELAGMRPVQRVRALNRKHLDALRVKLATETSGTQVKLDAAAGEVRRLGDEFESLKPKWISLKQKYEDADLFALANPQNKEARKAFRKAKDEYHAGMGEVGVYDNLREQAARKMQSARTEHNRAVTGILRKEVDSVNAEDGATERAREAWMYVADQNSNGNQLRRGADFAKDAAKSIEDSGTQEAKNMRQHGQEYLREVVNARFHANAITVPIAYEDTRAYAKAKIANGAMQASYVALSKGHPPSVIVHEFSHAIEHDNSEARAYLNEFLSLRVGTEKLTSLSVKFPDAGYEIYEHGRKDDFRKAIDAVYSDMSETERDRKAFYIGKKTRHGTTEVLTMGMEMMYHNATAFAKADPEYFDLVAGVVSGRLLQKTRKVE